MQFIAQGVKFIATRTTGPAHNFLALEFWKEGKAKKISIKDIVEANDAALAPRIIASEVLRKVQEGVNNANRKLKKNYRIKTIEYISSDTPPIEIYRHLAEYIVDQMKT